MNCSCALHNGIEEHRSHTSSVYGAGERVRNHLEAWVLDVHPACIARHKQVERVQLEATLQLKDAWDEELRTEQGIAGAGRHQASIAFCNGQRQVQRLDHQATGGSKEEGDDEPAWQYTQRFGSNRLQGSQAGRGCHPNLSEFEKSFISL